MIQRSLKYFAVAMALLTAAVAQAATNDLWLRDTALSPDGQHVAFRSNGDLFVAHVKTGAARVLRGSPAHETAPVWLPDGKHIAFAADTDGNYDVFVIDTQGNTEPRRLTWHSRVDVPVGVSPDGASLLIRSSRLDLSTSRALYPMRPYDEDNSQTSPWTSIYALPLDGGLPQSLVEPSSLAASWDPSGQQLAFSYRAGSESIYRKHERSPATQDIWLRETAGASFRRLTQFDGTDASPVWNAADGLIYFLSDRNGSMNVFRMPVTGDARAEQVTRHELFPVSGLSVSRSGVLSYSFRGSIFVGAPTGGFRKVAIRMPPTTRATRPIPRRDLSAFIRQGVLVPGGKEAIVVARGTLYAFDRTGRHRVLLASHPGAKSWPTLSANGRRMLVVHDEGTHSDLLLAELPSGVDTWLDARPARVTVLATTRSEVIIRAALSPDGTQAAFTTGLTLQLVKVADRSQRQLLTRAQGLGKYDQPFVWHPSGKYLALQWQAFHRMTSDIAVLSTADGSLTNVTQSGFDDVDPTWSADGRALFWTSDRHGPRSFDGDGTLTDEYALFLQPEAQIAYEKQSAALAGIADEREVNAWLAAIRAGTVTAVEARTRITPASSQRVASLIAPTQRFFLQLVSDADGKAVRRMNLPDGKAEVIARLPDQCDAGNGFEQIDALQLASDERQALIVAGCGVHWLDMMTGQANALTLSDVEVAAAASEQRWLFEHVVRTTRRVYYRPEALSALHWEQHVAEYRRHLPALDDPREFTELMNELLGELDSSHTHTHFSRNAPYARSASLGVIYDSSHQGAGWRIEEIMPGSPLARLLVPARAGDVVIAVEGKAIPARTDPAKLLLNRLDTYTTLTIESGAERRDVEVQLADNATEASLSYARWVAWQRRLTDELSKGRLGYVHMLAMGEDEFRAVIEDVLGRFADKDGIVVDLRFNEGGWMHEPLLGFFSAPFAFDLRSNGAVYASEPALRAGRPIVMLANAANYSNGAEVPRLFREQKLATLVGERIPGSGLGWHNDPLPYWEYWTAIAHDVSLTATGEYWEGAIETPDLEIAADRLALRAGRDVQLEAAVKSLLETLAKEPRQ